MRLHLLIGLLLLLPSVAAITATVEIDPADGTASTVNTLECLVQVTASGTLQANITWFVSGAPHAGDDETLVLASGVQGTTGAAGSIEPSDTARDDEWVCEATVWNETESASINSTAVTIDNGAPTITDPVTVQTVNEEQAYSLMATAIDPDADPITGWLSQDLNESDYPSALFTITSAGLISFTPQQEDVGNHSMALFASDGELYGGRTVVFRILEVDDAPVLDAVSTQTAHAGDPFTYNVSASDEENDPMNFSIDSDIPTLLITQTGNTTARLSFTPEYSHKGNHSVRIWVYASDNASNNHSRNFTLTVTADNQLPELGNATWNSSSQGQAFNFTIQATDNDTADTLNFSVTSDCTVGNPWSIETLDDNSSGAVGEMYVAALTNDHVACPSFNITVRDFESGTSKENSTRAYSVSITNVNDAPEVQEVNADSGNALEQRNMSNLTAPTDLPFVYIVSATDPDTLTYAGDNLTFSDNTSLFAIDTETGRVNFTPQLADVGEHLVNITVTDAGGLESSRVMNITVEANTFPNLTAVAAVTCNEDANCSVSFEANDPDLGDTLTFTVTTVNWSVNSNASIDGNLTLMNTSSNSSDAWKTYANDHVGNYTYNVTVTDRYGANDSQLFEIQVNNSNDVPQYLNTIDMPGPVVVGYETVLLVNASDDDFVNIAEVLTLNVTIIGPDSSLFAAAKIAERQWEVRFTPQAGDAGGYDVNFTVRDAANASVTQSDSFTVYNRSDSPYIDQVSPFYNTSSGSTEFANASRGILGDSTSITLPEGASYALNVTFVDNDTAPENLTVTWYRNGTVVQTSTGSLNASLSVTYGYFDSGEYNYTVNVSDNRYESDAFSFLVTVADVNRAPILLEDIPNRTMNQTVSIVDYFDVFYDPDDDTDSNGTIDSSESHSLTITHTDSAYITIAISGTDVTLTPEQVGLINITYVATDAGSLAVSSNSVVYNITDVPEPEPQTPNSGGGGGGGSRSTAVPIPVTQDPDPYSIEIISARPVVVYHNDTVAAPLVLRNPSENILREITLTANTSAENVSWVFSRAAFDMLQPGEERNLTLYINNYRTGGTYEITVYADAKDPEVEDSTTVFVNSLEKTSEGDAVQTKVTFAQDLLASNPECIELNEVLVEARKMIALGRTQEANEVIDAVVDGCRYLVSEGGKREEVPGGWDLSWLARFRHANVVLAGMLVLLVGLASALFLHYHSASKKE